MDEIEQHRQAVKDRIAAEWQRVEPWLKRAVEDGKYEEERHLRLRTQRGCDELTQEWNEWRLTQPPFITQEHGYQVRHPVTDENRNLLDLHR